MSPPDKRPPPLPDRKASVDKLVGAGTDYAASQDHVRPELARKGTLTGMGATRIPGPPPLPLEGAPTLKAPPNPLQHKTMRVASPPPLVAASRRTPIPPSDDPPAPAEAATGLSGASLPPMSQSPEAASNEALRRRAEAAEADRDELLRQGRVQAEARGPGPYQVPVRSQSPGPSSAPSKADAALGASLRHLLGKAAPFLLAAAGIGGGVTAVAKPGADPAKTDATLANVEAMRADMTVMREQLSSVIKWQATQGAYTKCLEEALDEVGEQLLPAQDRLANASPLRAYVKQRCARLRP